jgi:HlyD family secretion protein
MAYSARTFTLLGLGSMVLAGLAFVSFRTDPVPVDLVTVTRGPLEITVNAEGNTQVRDLFEVASPIDGTALRSPVEVGDAVVANETIVAVVRPVSSSLLDARSRLQAQAALQEARAARHAAVADLQRAQEVLAYAKSQFDRTQALVDRGVASLTRMEDDAQKLAIAEATVEAAQARIDMADGTIERAGAALLTPDQTDTEQSSCCVDIRAPTSGVVLDIDTISQRPVTVGSPLLSVGDPNELELVADILSTDGVRLSPGALAYVERWGGDGQLIARLDRIDPKARTKVSALGIEEQRVDAYFTLVSPIEERPTLGDGFAVFLRIVEWREEDVLQIPLGTIFRSGPDWAVFVASDGLAEKRIITLGRRNSQMTQVLQGLDAGEAVITHPSDEISNGARIVERKSL